MDSPVSHPGHIQLIFGPMFSGKSTELLRRTRRYTIATRKCIIIKYRADTRYSVLDMATHDKQTHVAIPCSKLCEVASEVTDFDVVGIDEGQFFPDLIEHCEKWANGGKTVIVAALDGTFQRKPFGSVTDLIPLCETVDKLNAVCQMCYRSAAFSARLGTESEEVVIGGAEKYLAVCRQCYQAIEEKRRITLAAGRAVISPPVPGSKAIGATRVKVKRKRSDGKQNDGNVHVASANTKSTGIAAAAAAVLDEKSTSRPVEMDMETAHSKKVRKMGSAFQAYGVKTGTDHVGRDL